MRFDYSDTCFKGTFGSKYLVVDKKSTVFCEPFGLFRQPGTGAAGVLLGTLTEQLIRESPSPVLAVKKKGECVGLLRVMLIIAGPEE